MNQFSIDPYAPGEQQGGVKKPLTPTQGAAYIEYVQSLANTYWRERGYSEPPRIAYLDGPRYVRIVSEGNGQRSIHTFLDKTNGDILKAGTWKAPAKNGVRGNVNIAGWQDAINHHGAKYLR